MKMKNILALILLISTSSASANQIRSKKFETNYGTVQDIDQIEAMQREIQALNAKIEKLEHGLTLIQNQLRDNLVKQTAILERRESTAEEVKVPEVASEVPKVSTLSPRVAKGNEKQEYDIALAALKGNDLKTAAEKFESFITIYPGSQLLSNAYFWYGEALFRQKIYDKSALNYLKSYKQAPKGAKAADSLFKLATTLKELNKKADACSMLNKLDNEFPARSATSIQKAQNLRTQMNCKL